MPEFEQIYRTRAAAFEQFIQPQNLPVKRAKFYDDCKRLKMVQVDKTVRLADLLAYVKTELQVDPGSGRSLGDEEAAREKDQLELRKLRADVLAKENANRKEDARWIQVVDHETQMAAFAGLVEDNLKQLTTLRLTELIYLCGGDVRKAAEFNQGLEDLYARAFTDAVREQTQVIGFEGDDDDAE